MIRFIPRPTGIRWLLSSHPLPPLLILPPLSLTLTLSSAILAFLFISFIRRSSGRDTGKRVARADKARDTSSGLGRGMTEEELLQERQSRAFDARERQEREEGERRQREWEEVESLARGGLQKIPDARKRKPESTVGGVSTIRMLFRQIRLVLGILV